ncbi:MAG TPA: hypothetical protein VFX76_00825 [Roseiflexaceae bacterium]|nr:hypothetical protein [Roseiflexaceae bacterium]
MRRIVAVALLLWLLVASALPARLLAQDEPAITMQIQAGYDGAYRVGEWFPAVITVANDGPDVRGVLEWRFANRDDEPTFQRAIDLPRGSRKRVTLDVFARDLVPRGQVRFLDGGTVLAEQETPIEAIDQDRFLIGVVSSDPALLNSLNSLSLPALAGANVRHLAPEMLPDRSASLRGVNALFVYDVDTAALTQPQRDALDLWVQLGGQLVVGGGSTGQRTAAGLPDLLPVEVGGELAQGDLTPLGQIAGVVPPEPGAATLSQARPREGAAALPTDQPLLYRWSRGAGAVTFAAFDLASLRGWAGEPDLWSRLLAPIEVLAPGLDARQRRLNLLQSTLRLPSLGLPSVWALLLFLIGYILIIGPINYLVLRRLRRLEWAWLTVPCAVLLFASGLYVVGFGLRGGQSQVSQVAIVQGSEGQSRGLATAFVGLFSPRRASYDLLFPANALVSEARTWNDVTNESSTATEVDAGTEVSNVLVDVGSVRTFMSESAVDVPAGVQSDLQSNGVQVTGQIRNTGSLPLEDAIIVRGSTFQELGTLAPGASQTVALGGSNNFPWGVNLSRSGLFDRQQMLSSLFEGGAARFGNPNNPNQAIEPQGLYLLAWSSAPSVPVSVDGVAADQQALTLYFIRLDEGVRFALTVPPTPTPAPTSDFLAPTPTELRSPATTPAAAVSPTP